MTEEFHWKNEEGLRIYGVDWRVAEPRAVIGLIHGLGEHCRRYDHVAAFFNEHRIAMVGYDRQGFGRSEGRKGYATSYGSYLDGVAQLLVHCERRYPGVPVFLYGQSMGGQLLLHYLIRRKPRIRGAIVTSPHIAEAFRPNPLVVSVGKLMRRLRPTFTLDNQLDITQLSRDPRVMEDYRNDPHNHSKLSSQVGIDLLERAQFLQQYSDGLSVPTLLLHGNADGITSFPASKAFAERNAGVEFRGYDGYYHELHNEPGHESVLQEVAGWVTAVIRSSV
jgi:alpha-beta hydrolase superfamily lysophospholipase